MRLLPAVSRGEMPIRSIVIGEWSSQCKSVDCFSCATFLFFFSDELQRCRRFERKKKKRSTYAHLHLLPKTKATKKGKSAGTHTKKKEKKKGLDFLFCASSGKVSCVLSAKVTLFCFESLFFFRRCSSPWSWIWAITTTLHHFSLASPLLFFSLLLLSLFCSHLLTRHVALGQGDKTCHFSSRPLTPHLPLWETLQTQQGSPFILLSPFRSSSQSCGTSSVIVFVSFSFFFCCFFLLVSPISAQWRKGTRRTTWSTNTKMRSL